MSCNFIHSQFVIVGNKLERLSLGKPSQPSPIFASEDQEPTLE
jgi:hypothetical protein